jgi:hypothetical protein
VALDAGWWHGNWLGSGFPLEGRAWAGSTWAELATVRGLTLRDSETEAASPNTTRAARIRLRSANLRAWRRISELTGWADCSRLTGGGRCHTSVSTQGSTGQKNPRSPLSNRIDLSSEGRGTYTGRASYHTTREAVWILHEQHGAGSDK